MINVRQKKKDAPSTNHSIWCISGFPGVTGCIWWPSHSHWNILHTPANYSSALWRSYVMQPSWSTMWKRPGTVHAFYFCRSFFISWKFKIQGTYQPKNLSNFLRRPLCSGVWLITSPRVALSRSPTALSGGGGSSLQPPWAVAGVLVANQLFCLSIFVCWL